MTRETPVAALGRDLSVRPRSAPRTPEPLRIPRRACENSTANRAEASPTFAQLPAEGGHGMPQADTPSAPRSALSPPVPRAMVSGPHIARSARRGKAPQAPTPRAAR